GRRSYLQRQKEINHDIISVLLRGSDDCTLYYTSSGPHIMRYDVCSGKQLPNLNSTPIGTILSGLRFAGAPPFDGHDLIVAGENTIYHVDTAGHVLGSYDAVGGQCWYSVAPDKGTPGFPDFTFLGGDYCGGDVYEFNFSSGSVVNRFSTGEGTHVKGVIVVPGVPGVTPPPTLPVNSCRITGGGSVFTTNGVRVTHGFQLRSE